MFSTCWTAIYPAISVIHLLYSCGYPPTQTVLGIRHAFLPCEERNGDGTQAVVGTSAWEARLLLDKYSFH